MDARESQDREEKAPFKWGCGFIVMLPDRKGKTKYCKNKKEVRERLSTSLNQLRQGILVENDSITVRGDIKPQVS